MEVQKLSGFVLLIVAVGMLIGVGMIVMENFGTATYYTRTGHNDSVTIVNKTGVALDYGNITSVTKVWNGTTNTLSTDCYTIATVNGSFTFTNDTAVCTANTGTVHVVYNYIDYATETRDATADVSTEIGNIASDWISLIVTIVILSIVLFLVIRSFRPGR